MFKQWRKRRKCDHDYHVVKRFRKWLSYEYVNYVWVYCPKCEHEYCEAEQNWEGTLAKQRLRQAYQEKEKRAISEIERLRDS